MTGLTAHQGGRVVIALAGVMGLVIVGVAVMVTGRAPSAPSRTPVIVELFTSQGCASCPPADELLIALDDEQFVSSALVIPLSQHVEYWNGLWNDPFSSTAFTERHRMYHPLLGATALYTPEMVVDGGMQFVGSQRMLAEHAIMRAAGMQKAVVDLEATTLARQDTVQVELTVSDLSRLVLEESLVLWVAVTEVALETDVQRGENARRRLRHAAVVRSLQPVDEITPPVAEPYSTRAVVAVEPEWRRWNLRIVAFLQETGSRHIRGAAQVALE